MPPRRKPLLAWLALLLLAGVAAPAPAADPSAPPARPPLADVPLPAGSELLAFENIEGLVLVPARLDGARSDTTGLLALDSGAGFLALDQPVAHALGVAEQRGPAAGIALAQRPLARLQLGALQIDHVTPLITIDGEVVRRVTGRDVIGLLGQRPLVGRAIVIDYAEERIAIVPIPQDRPRSVAASRAALGAFFSSAARAIPFDLEGDGKIVLTGHVSDPTPEAPSRTLTLILDTGATRCVLFVPSLEGVVERHADWRAMTGLRAPTLFGDEPASVALVPTWTILSGAGPVIERDVETVLIGGPLHRSLSVVIGAPVHGLIGYSLLSRYRVGIDYVNETLWLDPMPADWEGRPHRDSQVGMQIERHGRTIRVTGVVAESAADDAGVRVNDEIVLLDGMPAATLDLAVAIRRMEGPPGSAITVTLRRGTQHIDLRLERRPLL